MELPFIAKYLWLIPFLPLLAAGITALLRKEHRKASARIVIGAIAISFLLSLCALATTMKHHLKDEHGATTHLGAAKQAPEPPAYQESAATTEQRAAIAAGESAPVDYHDPVNHMVFNFEWLRFGDSDLRLGFVLDPLTAVMVVMVTLVGGLIFVYSVGYMAHDENLVRFFCFMSLFASAMLGLVMANNLLLLFVCWELVGLASYLLIGFWYHKPSAAEAAKKAFITTKIGDLGFLIGMLWLYHQSGTLLFYDNGNGCLELAALNAMAKTTLVGGLAASTLISLLIFCGAVGKSGQLPLHVWLPDAMEGPTPVSALIHAATMVAAGVFLVARMYPLFEADATMMGAVTGSTVASNALTWVAFIGAFTALFAAVVAVAQRDIKRILAYSTVSQLGYMMLALGVGGYVAGMFHLLTHAFFKALLFLGSGSVIHGCHEEQDVFQMGGLRRKMPVTFVTYGIGMLALAGIIPFAGFWSKDEILLDAHHWAERLHDWHYAIPFWCGIAGALLTAFYMTRQMILVFYGEPRAQGAEHAHESPPVMTVPLVILAAGSVVLGVLAFWLPDFLAPPPHAHHAFSVRIALGSTVVAVAGIGIGLWLYGRRALKKHEPDPLAGKLDVLYTIIENKFLFDEVYDFLFVRTMHLWARFTRGLDALIDGVVNLVGVIAWFLSWVFHRLGDEAMINSGFDGACETTRISGGMLSKLQTGQMTFYLRFLALGTIILFVIFVLVTIYG